MRIDRNDEVSYRFELVQREGSDSLPFQGPILILNLGGPLRKPAGSVPPGVEPVDPQQLVLR